MATRRAGTNINQLARLNLADYTNDDLIVIRSATNQKAMQTTLGQFISIIKSGVRVLTLSEDTVLTVDQVDNYDFIFADASALSIVITLPDAIDSEARMIDFKRVDATVNTVTINTIDSALIDGDANAVLVGATYPQAGVICDGSNWWLINA